MTEDQLAENAEQDEPVVIEESATSEEESTIQEPETNLDDQTQGENLEQENQVEKTNGVQKRINKLTERTYTEKARADEAERKLALLENQMAQSQAKEPTLEDFDYDEVAYQEAAIKYGVDQRFKQDQNQRDSQQREHEQRLILDSFNKRVDTARIEGFDESFNTLAASKILPIEIGEALFLDEKGPELIHYLGNNLEVADKLANMTSHQAAIEIGKLSVNLTPPTKKNNITKAPDPLSSVGSSGSIERSDAELSMEEIAKRYG